MNEGPVRRVSTDDRLRDFEELYAAAGSDLRQIPWARLAPHPLLVDWLDCYPPAVGQRALVVACGLGDDAEELARRGYRVTAFDSADTAIGWCRSRFSSSPVDYRVGDLFELPAEWTGRFHLVVEINTIQSLPPTKRRAAIAAIARTVAPGGRLWVRCLARDDDEPVHDRPWPLSRADLAEFVGHGLHELALRDEPPRDGRSRCFLALYTRGGAAALS